MTPIICAKTLPPKKRSPSSPTTRHAHSNIHSTSISMPSAISWNAASQNSSSSVASLPASKKPPEITKPSSLSLLSSYGCDKCPHRLVLDLLLGVKSQIFGKPSQINPYLLGKLVLLRKLVARRAFNCAANSA